MWEASVYVSYHAFSWTEDESYSLNQVLLDNQSDIWLMYNVLRSLPKYLVLVAYNLYEAYNLG